MRLYIRAGVGVRDRIVHTGITVSNSNTAAASRTTNVQPSIVVNYIPRVL